MHDGPLGDVLPANAPHSPRGHSLSGCHQVWVRIARTLDDTAAADIEAQLDDLRTAADDEDTAAADAPPRRHDRRSATHHLTSPRRHVTSR